MKANKKLQEQVIAFRSTGLSANKTAALVGCSRTHVSRIWQAAQLKAQKKYSKTRRKRTTRYRDVS